MDTSETPLLRRAVIAAGVPMATGLGRAPARRCADRQAAKAAVAVPAFRRT